MALRAFPAIALALVLLAGPRLLAAGEAPDPARRLLETLAIRRPDGPGPFPAIMMVPGCSGMSKTENAGHYRELGERLGAMGYLVAPVDYVGARQLTQACGSFVTPDDIAKDIIAVADRLRALASVDRARIDVIGESLGGGGVLAALGRPGSDARPPFRRAVVFYPVCRGVAPPRGGSEILMLFGALDAMTPAESCQEIVRRFPNASGVHVRVFPDARHGFNHAHLPQTPPAGKPSWTPAYNPAATQAAWEEMVGFLRR
ncbi:MAG TPA: dienelactone hydrolase family protein [Methylomirabilota bacterium]|jgi:dienelactone hydrolase